MFDLVCSHAVEQMLFVRLVTSRAFEEEDGFLQEISTDYPAGEIYILTPFASAFLSSSMLAADTLLIATELLKA